MGAARGPGHQRGHPYPVLSEAKLASSLLRPFCVDTRQGMLGFALLTTLLSTACGESTTQPSARQMAATCNPELWNHVYDPARLRVVDSCRTVTGVVSDMHTNEDGDIDMRMAVDPAFVSLLNDGNRSQLNVTCRSSQCVRRRSRRATRRTPAAISAEPC